MVETEHHFMLDFDSQAEKGKDGLSDLFSTEWEIPSFFPLQEQQQQQKPLKIRKITLLISKCFNFVFKDKEQPLNYNSETCI